MMFTGLGDDATLLASSISGLQRITYENFPSKEEIRERALTEGFKDYNDPDFIELVAQRIEEFTGIKR